MPLSFAKEKFVGIDIGHLTINIAQVERIGSIYRITGCATVPTPPGSVAEGVVTDVDAVADAIKQAMRESRISATTANLAVAGASVVVRTVKMPAMPEAALRKSIRFEAGRYVPSSVDESYIEFEIVRETEDGQMEVLLAACPRDMVESKLAAAAKAGLDVEVVDVEAFALYRTLVEADEMSDASEQTIAIIDVGGEGTQVSVIDKGIFALTRLIPIGGKALTTALQNYFKMSPEDAEAGKRALDLNALVNHDGPMENPPLRVVQPLVDELVREIRRSLNYYQSQQTDQGQYAAVSHILMAGGASAMQGLPNYIGNKLNLPATAPNALENPAFSCDAEEPVNPAAIAIALGLALRRPGKALAAA